MLIFNYLMHELLTKKYNINKTEIKEKFLQRPGRRGSQSINDAKIMSKAENAVQERKRYLLHSVTHSEKEEEI